MLARLLRNRHPGNPFLLPAAAAAAKRCSRGTLLHGKQARRAAATSTIAAAAAGWCATHAALRGVLCPGLASTQRYVWTIIITNIFCSCSPALRIWLLLTYLFFSYDVCGRCACATGATTMLMLSANSNRKKLPPAHLL